MTDTYFVTGSTGCIGSWVVRTLLREGHDVVALNYGDTLLRLETILEPEEIQKISFVSSDISDLNELKNVLEPYSISKIIHLAALQIPFCRANPYIGAKVNVVGTVNVFELAKVYNIQRVVYASSAGVYGPKEMYSEKVVSHSAPLHPTTHYGVYKMANEWSAKVYLEENGVSSIGLRPHVVYGPGRDQGMTSTPTIAMLAALLNKKYEVTFAGKYNFQHVEDIAKCFVKSSRVSFSGAGAFNIGGPGYSTKEIIETINEIVPESKGKLTHTTNELPFCGEYENIELTKVIGGISFKSLPEGISETIAIFRKAVESGLFTEEYIKKLIPN